MKYLFVLGIVINTACVPARGDKCGGQGQAPCTDTGCTAGTMLDDATGLCATCGYELGPCCTQGVRCGPGRTCMEALGRELSQICATAPACDAAGSGAGGQGAACIDNIWCCPGLACLSGYGGKKQCQPDPGTCWHAPTQLEDGGTAGAVANETGSCFHGEWCCPARWGGQTACVVSDGGSAKCQFH